MSHPNPPLSHFKAVVFLVCIFLIGAIVLIIRPTKAANLRTGTAASFVTPKGASSGGGIANVGPLRSTNVTIASHTATNPGIGILKFSDTLIANASDVGAYAASTFEVNSPDDSTDGSCTPVGFGNGCTLREAIERANNEPGEDLITFAASLTSVGPATITLSNALPDLSSDMNISGPGATLLTIQRSSVVGTPDFRIFTVPGSILSIAALTVTNGKTPNGSAGGTNGGPGGDGGAIHNSGTLTMRDVLVISNRTGTGGNASLTQGNGGKGGGIYNAGSLTMTNCTVSGNNAGNGGSGGTGGGGGGDGGGIYSTGSSLTLTNVIVSDNTAGSSTGASSFGGSGGGIFNHVPTTASMTNCTVSGNSSGNASGSSSTDGFAGGIQNNGALTVIASTISGNTSNGPGGGLMNQGAVTLVNTTISGNSGIFGGGIYDDITTAMFLTNCTITNNTASNHQGVITYSGGSARVRNTVIAGNDVGPDVTGLFTSQGNNLIGIPGSGGISGGGTGFVNGSNGDQVGSTASPLNALLGTLSDNGGPTQTHALLAGSTAIDAGNNCVLTNACSTTLPSAITDDQRGAGFSRNVDGLDADTTKTVDIGAFEAQVSLGDIADQTINEDGSLSLPFKVYGALSITSVTATSSNTALVPNDPANISISGSDSSWTLSINPLANAFGTSTITLTVNANDGQTVTNTFLLTVNSVNDVPSFSEGVDQTVNEDAGLQTVNWATLISAGPANEGGQTLSFTVTNNNNALFSGQPVINSAGTLSYTPAANANGMATVSVTLKDSGGTANGGQDTATVETFEINVIPINDAPSFSGADRTVNENDSAQTVANWATNISVGPANESVQTVSFVVVSNSNPSLFAIAPAVSPSGTLTYTPQPGMSGAALIGIAVKDNGGTAGGGIDTSATQTFNLSVLEGGTLALSSATYNVAENAGSAAITITRSGGSAGTATVLLQTSNGTATSADYTSVSQTITLSDGELTKTVNISIADDLFKEPDETVNVALSSAGGSGQLGAQSTAGLTILDDDPIGGYIRFSSADFNTTESSGSTTITVERVGDTSQAVSVNYATVEESLTVQPCSMVNQFASSRCDFTPALGTLQFAVGESSKTFAVLISQDSYVEDAETLTLALLSSTGGAVLATPFSAPLTITDDATEPPTNPIDTADAFVRQHYHDFLNREPDAGGLAFWSNQITECQQPGATCNAEVRRINVSAAFFVSIEFQETGYLVYRTYTAAYGNLSPTAPVPLTFNEFLPDTRVIGQGVEVNAPGWEQQLETNKAAFFLDFVSRLRFRNTYPTTMSPEAFVDALFTKAAVAPSAAERSAAIGEFNLASDTADSAARARALRRVAENPALGQQERDKAFVLMQYFGYLRRNPNDAPEPGLNFDGYNFWLNKLNEFDGNYIAAEMVKAFINSSEYRQRFGP